MGRQISKDIANRKSYDQEAAQSAVVAAGSTWESLPLVYDVPGETFSGVANMILQYGGAIVASTLTVNLIHGFRELGDGEPVQLFQVSAAIGTTTKMYDIYNNNKLQLADYYKIQIVNSGSSDATISGRLVLQ